MAPDDLFTRDEVLGGLPARRAAATLFLVESRAAHLADRSRRAADFLLSEDAERRRDLHFLEAFSGGREPPVKPGIHDLEQFAPQWASLVPANPPLRAAIAHMLGRKYRFTRAVVPRLRVALGLDDDAVERAYRRQYREELSTIYAARTHPLDRLGAAWGALSARIDSLSPFWLTFALTIAFSFSQAVLALPTGVASMGAGPGALLVIGVGLVNVLTMACMAEACARNGDFRYGRAFLGRLVTGYLGAEASLVFSIVAALRTFLVTLAGSIGIGLTLASSTGIRAELWIAALTAVELYYLSRRSLNVTITTMLSLLAVNLTLFLLITLFAVRAIEPANLARAASVPTGAAFDPSVLRLVIGVVVMLYIGHVYVIQCAKIVLPRDPSARSLIRGSVAGTATMIVLFIVWMLAVNGVVSADRLVREAGTALPPLAERIGPAVKVLGSLLVVILLGMSCLRTTTVLFNLVQERLPTRLRIVVTLARRRGDLFFEPRLAGGGVRIGVRYLGLSEGRARLRVEAQHDGELQRADVVVADTWDASEVFARLGGVRPGTLTIEVLDADPDSVRLRVTTTMSARTSGEWPPVEQSLMAATELAEPLRGLVTWLTRRGEATASEIARERAVEAETAHIMLDELVTQGFVERVDDGPDPRYRIRLAARRRRPMPQDVWAALDPPRPADAVRRRRPTGAMLLATRNLLMSEAGQFVVSLSPIFLVFVVGEAMLLTGSASFAGVLGFGGVIANSLTSGIFPVLLLVASRRKGDYEPGTVYRLIGHPVFTASVYALSVANLFVHGLVIYRDPWTRGCALLFGTVVLVITIRMARAGAFSRRSVIELRQDMRQAGAGLLTVMSDGRPLTTEVTLTLSEGDETSRSSAVKIPALSKLRTVIVRLPAGRARELKVWVHRVTTDGTSESVPALVEVRRGAETEQFDMKLSSGQVNTRMSGADCVVRITLPTSDGGLC
jgi:hypothetical protein